MDKWRVKAGPEKIKETAWRYQAISKDNVRPEGASQNLYAALFGVPNLLWSSHKGKRLFRYVLFPFAPIHCTPQPTGNEMSHNIQGVSLRTMFPSLGSTVCFLKFCRVFQVKLHVATEGLMLNKFVYGIKYVPAKAVVLWAHLWSPSPYEKIKLLPVLLWWRCRS